MPIGSGHARTAALAPRQIGLERQDSRQFRPSAGCAWAAGGRADGALARRGGSGAGPCALLHRQARGEKGGTSTDHANIRPRNTFFEDSITTEEGRRGKGSVG